MDSASIYTWQTPKGELSLYEEQGNYNLRLLTKNNQEVGIAKEKLYGTLPDFQSKKITDVFNQYLPIIQKESGSDSFNVTFHLSTFPGNKEVLDGSEQDTKKFGFDFNKLETVVFVKFSDTAPSYRRVVAGLNFEGTCSEKTCNAFKKSVCIPLGYGKFNVPLKMSQSVCPACDTALEFEKIKNLGFWNCHYSIEGAIDDGTPIKKDEDAPVDKYKTFKPGDECTWRCLEVETKPIVSTTDSNDSGCTIL